MSGIIDVKDDLEFWKNETIAFLAISSLKGVGFWSLHKIVRSEPSLKSLLKASEPERLEKYLRVSVSNDDDWASVQVKLWADGIEKARYLKTQGIALIFSKQANFPQKLRSIKDPPLWIFAKGPISNLSRQSIGIVGTRKPSIDGLFLTKMTVALLSGLELLTVSGLAYGIDQAAHEESLTYNIPTIAVLGNGLLIEYPRGSNELQNRIIAKGGTVISEYLPDQTFSAENFIRRNRLQAALSDLLIPVEWRERSGTAHTVRFAQEYGKKVISLCLPNGGNRDLEDSSSYSKRFTLPQQGKDFIDYMGLLKSGSLKESLVQQESFDI